MLGIQNGKKINSLKLFKVNELIYEERDYGMEDRYYNKNR